MARILTFENFLLEYIDLNHIKSSLSSNKFKHSKRVGGLTKQIKDDKDIYSAAVYHDFLERGGVETEILPILSTYALELVKALSSETNDDVLINLKNVLSGKSKVFINDILIIKLCDRSDNLKKRAKKDILGKGYVRKSAELIQWIWNNYTGDKLKMKQFVEIIIFSAVPKLRNKIVLI